MAGHNPVLSVGQKNRRSGTRVMSVVCIGRVSLLCWPLPALPSSSLKPQFKRRAAGNGKGR